MEDAVTPEARARPFHTPQGSDRRKIPLNTHKVSQKHTPSKLRHVAPRESRLETATVAIFGICSIPSQPAFMLPKSINDAHAIQCSATLCIASRCSYHNLPLNVTSYLWKASKTHNLQPYSLSSMRRWSDSLCSACLASRRHQPLCKSSSCQFYKRPRHDIQLHTPHSSGRTLETVISRRWPWLRGVGILLCVLSFAHVESYIPSSCGDLVVV